MLELVSRVHVGVISFAHLASNPRKEIQHPLDAIMANDESIALSLADKNVHFIGETAVVTEMLEWEPPPIVGERLLLGCWRLFSAVVADDH